MSRVTLAFGSFIVGACSMFFVLSGNHTSTFAQIRPEAVPVVPTLPPLVSKNNSLNGGTFHLDGVYSRGDVFENVTVEYGGGAFRLENARFDGPIRLSPKGAAANTLVLIQFWQAVEAQRQPKPVVPQAPILQLANIKQPVTSDLISAFGQK